MPAQFFLILRFRFLALSRAARERAFAAFVLAPLIVVGAWFVMEPTLERFAGWFETAAANWSSSDFTAAGLLIVGSLAAAGTPAAIREVFALRSPDVSLNALPVKPLARFVAAVVTRVLGNLPGFVAVWLLLGLAARQAGGAAAAPGARLALSFVEIASMQLLLALLFVRFHLFRPLRWLAVAASLGLIAWAALGDAAWAWAAGPLALPAFAWRDIVSTSLGSALPPDVLGSLPLQAVSIALLLAAAAAAHASWRDILQDDAAALVEGKRRRGRRISRPLARFFDRPTAAQIARDLRLTLRAFSPAVYIAGTAAAVFLAASFAIAGSGRIPEPWIAPLLLFGLALACLSASALAPLLLEDQLRRFWVERASGAPPDSLWKAKSRYAMIVAAPALAVTLFAATGFVTEPLPAVLFAARATLVWLSVSTMIGTTAIETAQAPVVGLLLSGMFSIGVCGLYVLEDFWPLGLFFYAYVMHHLAERAEAVAATLGAEA